MDKQTLIAAMDYTRARLLGSLDGIEKSGQDVQKVLGWRPGPGRAHIGWQAIHCAATHDKYANHLQGKPPQDPELVKNFGGGSTPSDANVPTLAQIRQRLETNYAALKNHVESLRNEDLDRTVTAPSGKEMPLANLLHLLTWHEAHHQGQIHLTWNLYKAAHGVG